MTVFGISSEKQNYELSNFVAYIEEKSFKNCSKFSHQFDIPKERLIFDAKLTKKKPKLTKPQMRLTYF